MKLIVGLGNPGDKYKATRHNAGFWFVERLAAQSGTVLRKDGKFQALVGRHEASGAWLVLPQTFMNASGRSVQMMASFFRIQPGDILVVHDELDLPPGTTRLKQGGGVAGHNGLKDISARLSSHDYWRLRLGVGRPPQKGAAVEYVLHKPAQAERAAIDDAISRALEVLPTVFAGDMQGAMLKLHTRDEESPEAPAAGQDEQSARESEPKRPPAAPGKTETTVKPVRPAATDAAGKVEAAAEEAPPSTDRIDMILAEPPPRIEKASTVERFARLAQVANAAPPAGNGKPAQLPPPPPAEPPPPSEKVEKPARKGAFSLLKKFLPGADPARKK